MSRRESRLEPIMTHKCSTPGKIIDHKSDDNSWKFYISSASQRPHDLFNMMKLHVYYLHPICVDRWLSYLYPVVKSCLTTTTCMILRWFYPLSILFQSNSVLIKKTSCFIGPIGKTVFYTNKLHGCFKCGSLIISFPFTFGTTPLNGNIWLKSQMIQGITNSKRK